MANGAIPDATSLFDFVVVRAPAAVESKALEHHYVFDDVVVLSGLAARIEVDLQSADSPSAVGKLVYEKVICETYESESDGLAALYGALLGLLTLQVMPCPDDDDDAGRPVSIWQLERHAHLGTGKERYLLPDRLDALAGQALVRHVLAALPILRSSPEPFDRTKLLQQLEQVFDGQRLWTVVFSRGAHSAEYRDTKRALFDALYLLYVLRRVTTVNLEHVMAGLGVLHTLEALAIDELLEDARGGRLTDEGSLLLRTLPGLFPALANWDQRGPVDGFPLVKDHEALNAYLSATPVVHPIFARLFRYDKPFNDVRPLGIGDLKVVKQWLTSYEESDISDIHNVMLGESKERMHRRLEKTEETFSFTSEQEEETTRDTQSTDRFEVKREAQQVIKTDLNVNATLNATYDNKPVLVNVGAGFAYTRSSTTDEKLAQNFSREVVAKAVSRVQNRALQQRSVTKLFETEETNKHGFNNVKGKGHVSGIYRWVDKRYTAQLFNFGKRMMFEFIVPEPAAFLVEARLRAFEASLEYPQPPKSPTYKKVALGFEAKDIDYPRFQQLRQEYDLADFAYPRESRAVVFNSQESGQPWLREIDLPKTHDRYAKSHQCRLDATGYQIDLIRVYGNVTFHNKGETDPADFNIFGLMLDGSRVHYDDNLEAAKFHPWDWSTVPLGGPLLLTDDTVELVLLFQDVWRYSLVISAELGLSDRAREDWQVAVFNAVEEQESTRVEEVNRELAVAYDARMAEYRNRIADLEATAINDLLQGRSEAFNREVILTELKKLCLAYIAKEFDADATDDLLTPWETIGGRLVDFEFRRLKVEETAAGTTVFWEDQKHAVAYPSIRLDDARRKGRFIQYLEQAFEWRQLAYLLYPYFWSTPPKWVAMMDRVDEADPNLTAFLQAGAARVLVAVTPAYDEAVLHFIATREPWEGGPSPVIGDPLYIPLFEELRKQQDDRYNAVAEGKPWTFVVPTSLAYLHQSTTPLPKIPQGPR